MSNVANLNKLVKKGQTIGIPTNLHDHLIKLIANEYAHGTPFIAASSPIAASSLIAASSPIAASSIIAVRASSADNTINTNNEHGKNSKNNTHRELLFLSSYYGLSGIAQTLESIGASQSNQLTRERVRQIINVIIAQLKKKSDNPHNKAYQIFENLMVDKTKKENTPVNFLRLEELLIHSSFKPFSKNVKGLIAFLNDSNIRQIAYRKKYYFYAAGQDRVQIIESIQLENKGVRRSQTEEKMRNKAKTVTYVPKQIRAFLHGKSESSNINLNSLYEQILVSFLKNAPYGKKSEKKSEYVFPKTQSWRARKGKASWEQVGIYIDKAIFDNIKTIVKNLKKSGQSVSVMSFICQSFVWYWESI